MSGLNANIEIEQEIHNIIKVMKQYSCSYEEFIENINFLLNIFKNYGGLSSDG